MKKIKSDVILKKGPHGWEAWQTNKLIAKVPGFSEESKEEVMKHIPGYENVIESSRKRIESRYTILNEDSAIGFNDNHSIGIWKNNNGYSLGYFSDGNHIEVKTGNESDKDRWIERYNIELIESSKQINSGYEEEIYEQGYLDGIENKKPTMPNNEDYMKGYNNGKNDGGNYPDGIDITCSKKQIKSAKSEEDFRKAIDELEIYLGVNAEGNKFYTQRRLSDWDYMYAIDDICRKYNVRFVDGFEMGNINPAYEGYGDHTYFVINNSRQIKSSPNFKKYTADDIFDLFSPTELTHTVFMDREECKNAKCGMEEFMDLMSDSVVPTWLGVRTPDDIREVCRRAKNSKAKTFLEDFETALENAKFTDRFYDSVTVHKKGIQSSQRPQAELEGYNCGHKEGGDITDNPYNSNIENEDWNDWRAGFSEGEHDRIHSSKQIKSARISFVNEENGNRVNTWFDGKDLYEVDEMNQDNTDRVHLMEKYTLNDLKHLGYKMMNDYEQIESRFNRMNTFNKYTLSEVAQYLSALFFDLRTIHFKTTGNDFLTYHELAQELYEQTEEYYDDIVETAISFDNNTSPMYVLPGDWNFVDENNSLSTDGQFVQNLILDKLKAIYDVLENVKEYDSMVQSKIDSMLEYYDKEIYKLSQVVDESIF